MVQYVKKERLDQACLRLRHHQGVDCICVQHVSTQRSADILETAKEKG